MNNYTDIEQKFLVFFKSRGHHVHEPANVVNPEGAVTMFNIAGMQQFVPYFLGQREPEHKRIATSQPCIRIGGKNCDLNIIGTTTRHTTLFKMLGNFSFGDYFKEDAIKWAVEFLKSIDIDFSYIYVTVHPEDLTAFDIWTKYINRDRIIGLESNIWTMGTVGPFGHCTEIFYDTQERKEVQFNEYTLEEMLEIWNIVFMEFEKTTEGVKNLPKPCVDTGAGLERLASITERTFDSFYTTALKDILGVVHRYNSDKPIFTVRMFADHIRTSIELIKNGILPSNKEQGYVLRQLIRKCFQINGIQDILEDLNISKQISQIICEELVSFQRKIDETMPMMLSKTNPTEEDIFFFKDTHGIPYQICESIYNKSFDHSKLQQIAKSKIQDTNCLLQIDYDQKTDKMCYETTQCTGQIRFIHYNPEQNNMFVVTDRSCFYPNGGGQPGDKGQIINEQYTLHVTNTIQSGYNETILHVTNYDDRVTVGDMVVMQVDEDLRKKHTRSHSATHLLGDYLEEHYNIEIVSASVGADHFRLDYKGAVTIKDHISQIEQIINEYITSGLPVEKQYENIRQTTAKRKANVNYGDIVRTVHMGNLSYQLCGGTHVNNINEIIHIQIEKDLSLGKGIRRLQCVCGDKQIDRVFNNHNTAKSAVVQTFQDNIFSFIGTDRDAMNFYKKHKLNSAVFFISAIDNDNNKVITFNYALPRHEYLLMGQTKDQTMQIYQTKDSFDQLCDKLTQ